MVVLSAHSRLSLPVQTTAGSTSFTVTAVDVAAGVIVPIVLGAAVFLSGAVADRRARAVESSLSASITVFLLAELNGIHELGALVAIYALTSAAVLFGVLQQRPSDPPSQLPGVFGAMVGIVPWGVIAWYEIAPMVVDGPGPASWVRAVTLVALVLFAVTAVVAWRSTGMTRRGIVLSVVTRSVVGWIVIAAAGSGLTVG